MKEPFSPNFGLKYPKEGFNWSSLDYSLSWELGGLDQWWAAHSWTLVDVGEEPSPKRKGMAVWYWLMVICITIASNTFSSLDWGHTGTTQSLLAWRLHQVPGGGLSSGGSTSYTCGAVLVTLLLLTDFLSDYLRQLSDTERTCALQDHSEGLLSPLLTWVICAVLATRKGDMTSYRVDGGGPCHQEGRYDWSLMKEVMKHWRQAASGEATLCQMEKCSPLLLYEQPL